MPAKPFRWIRVAGGGLALALLAPLAAWAIDPDTDPAYWMIRLGGVFSKWPAADVPVPLEASQNYLCRDTLNPCTPLGNSAISAAINNAAVQWNDALARKRVEIGRAHV